jgi:hypothetical protein
MDRNHNANKGVLLLSHAGKSNRLSYIIGDCKTCLMTFVSLQEFDLMPKLSGTP